MITGRTTRAVFFPAMMGALLLVYAFHPVAGWSVMAALAGLTAAWHHRRAVAAVGA